MPPRRSSAPSSTGSRPATERTAGDEDLLAALQRFIRTKGEDYLRDPNVSSIGIGYKVTDGRQTPEISVQFTVNEKHSAPGALEALRTAPLPASITVDGVTVPTDVIERRYEPAFRVVPEPAPADRKVRIDPVVPGASVGHVRVSAGTIGAIVYDRADGTPYVREPGGAASRSATSACTMTRLRRSEGKRSSMPSRTGTATLYGRLATSAVGAPSWVPWSTTRRVFAASPC